MKVKRKRIAWDAVDVADLAGYNVYVADASVEAFTDAVDAGSVLPVETVQTTSYVVSPNDRIEDGVKQFVVTAIDAAGNESDPLQAEAWKSVPLDRTAPPAPTGGVVESF